MPQPPTALAYCFPGVFRTAAAPHETTADYEAANIIVSTYIRSIKCLIYILANKSILTILHALNFFFCYSFSLIWTDRIDVLCTNVISY
jgi:hypothetical protein